MMWKGTVFLHLVSEPQMGQSFLALESDSFQSEMIVFRPSLSQKKGKQKTKLVSAQRQCFMALREQCGQLDIQTPI